MWLNLVRKHSDNDNRCDLASAYTVPDLVLNGCYVYFIFATLCCMNSYVPHFTDEETGLGESSHLVFITQQINRPSM